MIERVSTFNVIKIVLTKWKHEVNAEYLIQIVPDKDA